MTTQEMNTENILAGSGINYTIQEKAGLLVCNAGRFLVNIKLSDFNASIEEIGVESTIENLSEIVNNVPRRRALTLN